MLPSKKTCRAHTTKTHKGRRYNVPCAKSLHGDKIHAGYGPAPTYALIVWKSRG